MEECWFNKKIVFRNGNRHSKSLKIQYKGYNLNKN